MLFRERAGAISCGSPILAETRFCDIWNCQGTAPLGNDRNPVSGEFAIRRRSVSERTHGNAAATQTAGAANPTVQRQLKTQLTPIHFAPYAAAAGCRSLSPVLPRRFFEAAASSRQPRRESSPRPSARVLPSNARRGRSPHGGHRILEDAVPLGEHQVENQE